MIATHRILRYFTTKPTPTGQQSLLKECPEPRLPAVLLTVGPSVRAAYEL